VPPPSLRHDGSGGGIAVDAEVTQQARDRTPP